MRILSSTTTPAVVIMVGSQAILAAHQVLAKAVPATFSHGHTLAQQHGALSGVQYLAVPSNFTPTYNISACSGYRAVSVTNSSSSFVANLELAGSACNAFAPDTQSLVLQVDYQTASRVHVHIYDKDKTQFQVPESTIATPNETIPASQSDLQFMYDSEPFAFWIVRKRTGDIIFDTRAANIPTYQSPIGPDNSYSNSTAMPAHPLIFSTQYLQLSSALPQDANIYGLGEYYSGNYRRNSSYTMQPFWAADVGDPVDANMYGYHAVYQESRTRKGAVMNGTTDTHAVWIKNSHGMDVILRDGVIQYRIIGGTFDFYFYSGDDHDASNTTVTTGSSNTSSTAINSAVTTIEQYVQSVGLPQVPPQWAFGYHQCRWGYTNLTQNREVVEKMRAANIPLETMWNDIDWMHAYRNFEADPIRFTPSDYQAFVSGLHENHQYYIPIIDAAISVQVPNGTDTYGTFTTGREAGAFIMNTQEDLTAGYNASGIQNTTIPEYVGIVWPGYTVFPDWWAKGTQGWWTSSFSNMSSYMDFDGIWLDMNEPSSFCRGSCGTGQNWNVLPPSVAPQTDPTNFPEGYNSDKFGKSGNMTVNGTSTYDPSLNNPLVRRDVWMQNDVVPLQKRADVENSTYNPYDPAYAIHNVQGQLDEKTVAANASTALGMMYDVKNIWGMEEEIVTYRALQKLKPTKRPFLISRSTFAGAGKYTGHWLGDNYSTWRYLWHNIQGFFQMQLFGIPMTGADTCGFAGNSNEELCNRWMAMSAWGPFYRNHNVLLAISQEPYVWDSVAEVTRKVIAARYALLPMWQTLFANAASKGTPVMRTLWQEFPGKGYESADRQFIVGDSLLVTPVLEPNVTSVMGVFPAANGPWRDYWTYEVLNVTADTNTSIPSPLSHINVHIRPGKTLLMYSQPGYTTYETSLSPYNLLVSLDDAQSASGTAYHDDGETQWTTTPPGTTVAFTAGTGSLSITPTKIGMYSFVQNLTSITVLGVPTQPSGVKLGTAPVGFSYNSTIQGLTIANTSVSLNTANVFSWS